MTYKAFTASQRETVQALVAEMKDLSALWIDTPCSADPLLETRADWIYRCALDWDQTGSYQERGAYIKDLRASVRACRRSQAEIFAAIKALGLIVRKTEYGEIRVADPAIADLEDREAGAAYCSDLAEALATAVAWKRDRDAVADRADRERIIAEYAPRAALLLAAKRLAYGDRFATADEAAMQQADPLAWLELIADQFTAETGLTYRGSWATESEIERARSAAEAEALEAKAAANRCPDRAPDCSAPSPEAIAQLVTAAKAARFALESACYLQGLRALAPSVLQLTEALEAFEPVEVSAEAQMRAAALSGRPDLAA